MDFTNTAGAAANTFPLSSMIDAEPLRSRILSSFQDANRDAALGEQGELNCVIVVVGATDTEIAGGLAEMIHPTITAEWGSRHQFRAHLPG